MATVAQIRYIEDLAVLKTKEVKEFKESVYSSGIVDPKSEVVAQAETIAQVSNALTDMQASQLIESLVAAKSPLRSRIYSDARVRKTIAALDEAKAIIDEWGF